MSTLLPRPMVARADAGTRPDTPTSPPSSANVQVGPDVRVVPLHNAFGAVLPPLDPLAHRLLGVPAERVLDLAAVQVQGLDLTALPFADHQFEVAICRGVLDEVADPAAVCRELQRVARRGVIELPQRVAAITLGCAPTTQWLASVVDGALVLQRRPFVRHPFGQPRLSPLAQSGDGQLLLLWQLRNAANVTFCWEDGFDCEVHDDGGYRTDDDEQLGLAWLDVAECSMRWQHGDLDAQRRAAERACSLLPQSARARYVLGQWLWLAGRTADAATAFAAARTLAPDDRRIAAVLARPLDRLPASLPAEQPHALDRAFWQLHAHDAGLDLAALATPPRRRLPPQWCGDPRVSRFVREGDACTSQFFFELPAVWWSRGHEYAWAQQFAGPEHVVLDAACGISHPLKFALAQHCRAAFACDLDARIVDPEAIVADIAADFGDAAARTFPREVMQRLERACCSITATPYAAGMFDRVFCISVLEHMPPADRAAALREFARIVRPDGLVVLTMDHPLVDLGEFVRLVAAAGLRFVGDVRLHVPPDALASPDRRLRCFRALLQRA
ncbi:MAG: methyltransferase domain-containing protein [Planctomycetota bacterium]|jgi:ubiquinone/menaquinone biosynthesis C-methylase UbiE